MAEIKWNGDEDLWQLDVCEYCAENYPGKSVYEAPEWIRNVYFVSLLQLEVFNGGFNQYIYNTGGKYLDDTLMACQKLGLQELIPLIREGAGSWLEKLKQKSFKDLLDGTLEGFSKIHMKLDLHHLDKQFYDQESVINEKIKDYIRLHKS
jgi:hypothetical protein